MSDLLHAGSAPRWCGLLIPSTHMEAPCACPLACLAPAAAVGQKQPSLSSCRWGDGILGFPLTCRIQAQMQHVDHFDSYLPSVRRTAQCRWVRPYPGGDRRAGSEGCGLLCILWVQEHLCSMVEKVSWGSWAWSKLRKEEGSASSVNQGESE